MFEGLSKRLGDVLEKRAHEFQHTPQIGRTHGIHAEPITFGLKVANWFAAANYRAQFYPGRMILIRCSEASEA